MSSICKKCGDVIKCPSCDLDEDDLFSFSSHFDYFDKGIIRQFARGLIERDKKKIDEAVCDSYDRISGRCFCFAYEKDECICGAWDD